LRHPSSIILSEWLANRRFDVNALFVETISWSFVEGLSKWFIFLAFWFVTPAVLPAWIVRRITGPVSFVTALYTVALMAAIANWCLAPDWKFLPDRLPTRTKEELNLELIEAAKRAEERASSQPGQEFPRLTQSKSLGDYTKWKEQYDKRKDAQSIATIIILLVTVGLALVGKTLLRHLPTPSPTLSTEKPASAQGQVPIVIGAWLFALGTTLDFIKWWNQP
jgi:hypothetical protein